jgi:hypothetical protein
MTTASSRSTKGFGKISFLVYLSLCLQSATAFTFVQGPTAGVCSSVVTPRCRLMMTSPVASSSDPIAQVLECKSGKEITQGAVVRVSTDGLQAFQISPKGQGTYDESKQFVPLPKGSTTGKYLIVPAGLTGVVTKIYDMEVVSANFPVQVKFQPGEHVEEGYEAPVAFLMHFLPEELECI